VRQPDSQRIVRRLAAVASALAMALALAGPGRADEPGDERPARQFTFSWQFLPDDAMRPRGGTSRGPAVQLATAPSAAWAALREDGIGKFERDRRAILAMAGGFRTSFDFIETVGFTADYAPARPYQSWSTEYIDVLEDRGTAITLQHTIVMEYVDAEGNVQGPVVQKHWRQDWVYEDPTIHEFAGHGLWRERRPAAREIAGKWSQAVYQVDDSPRYEAYGAWTHTDGYSSWQSETTWRPLPRRESSVRSDYDVLIGTNTHTITPGGWVHEENNLKAVLGDDGALRSEQPYLARELGLNRYELIEGFEFSAREPYWAATGAFWDDVRDAWAAIYARSAEFTFDEAAGGAPLFQPMFEYAFELENGREYDAADSRRFVAGTLADYVAE